MDPSELLEGRGVEIGALGALAAATKLNSMSGTPVTYLSTVLVVLCLVYAAKRFQRQFGTELISGVNSGWNHWAGAFGGVGAFAGSMYLSGIVGSLARVGAEYILFVSFGLLMLTLWSGSLLQGIQRGERDVRGVESREGGSDQ